MAGEQSFDNMARITWSNFINRVIHHMLVGIHRAASNNKALTLIKVNGKKQERTLNE